MQSRISFEGEQFLNTDFATGSAAELLAMDNTSFCPQNFAEASKNYLKASD